MTIAVGDHIPDVTIQTPTPEGPKPVQTGEALGHGKVVLFAVPGAFTPTCSDYHLPGFVMKADELSAKGVGTIACVAVNDAFVLKAWGEQRGVGDSVLLLADGSADFTRALGMDVDLAGAGFGTRSKRYAAVLDDGVVSQLMVEGDLGLEVSSADAVLASL
ncbi:MAG: redoxin family protein [Acidimicrobiales bacterium]